MPIIEVCNLKKDFKIHKHSHGFKATAKSLFHREYQIKRAVDDVSFTIERGESVGYIGPNGAGKSTTIKMLTGILYPTAGSVFVRGLVPQKHRKENAMHIGVVFGQRSQLYWDLPLCDTLSLYRKMYHVEQDRFDHNVAMFRELLDMDEFFERPVRQLSLGQKMRAELMVSLLHDPEILYLDEPTIGLDIVAKKQIREFIRSINIERKTTVILTTHDMDDIEQVCQRLILIDRGQLLYDGGIKKFKESYAEESTVDFTGGCFAPEEIKIPGCSTVTQLEDGKFQLTYDSTLTSRGQVLKELMTRVELTDFVVKEPRLEDILRTIYAHDKNACKA